MSSSPRRAPVSPAPMIAIPIPAASDPLEVQSFSYSEVAVPAGPRNFSHTASPREGESAADLVAMAQARESGRQQGERESGAKFEEQLAHERLAVANALADFARERAAYYRKIEEEAV